MMSKRIISGLIALVMTVSCAAAFAESARHERVYAVIGADGTVRSLTDSIHFLEMSGGNINATENSTHRYGTTFDLSYWRYVKVPELRERPYADVPPEYLRATLSQVLKDLHDEGACYVKYEKKQTCFHITVRK